MGTESEPAVKAGPGAGSEPPAEARPGGEALAADVAGTLERVMALLRWLSPATGLSLTAASTLAELERSGPRRLTALAEQGGVSQPAMTQLAGRLEDLGLVARDPDPADGRVVQLRITAEGRAVLASRRAVRAERLAGLLARLSPADRAALTAALPALDQLAGARREDPSLVPEHRKTGTEHP